MTADLDTRSGELYPAVDELLPDGQVGCDAAADAARSAITGAAGDRDVPGFDRSREQFESLMSFLDGSDAAGLSHGELEERLDRDGRELLRRLLDDHLALRALREPRLEKVTGADEVARGRVESGHQRALETVFGTVTVTRLAYRSPKARNLHPADAALNLPIERHSHGLRRLAALEAPRGSFQDALDAIWRASGQRLGKRQIEELAALAAVDFEDFYAQRRPPAGDGDDLLVLSADGKGIVDAPGRAANRDPGRAGRARAEDPAGPWRAVAPQADGGDRRGVRRAAGAAHASGYPRPQRRPRSQARSGSRGNQQVAVRQRCHGRRDSDQACVRGGLSPRPRARADLVALVDGNNHQIQRINAEAMAREVKVTIVVDFIHVLEYIWRAAACFYDEGHPTVHTWVNNQATKVLQGHATRVAGAIRRTATNLRLDPAQRRGADEAAAYLTHKAPYLDYPTALANGWPIATGIVEGACRHLFKDRLDITGARWGLAGAEAILKLRAITANGDFDAYWAHHLKQERHHVHQARYLNHTIQHAA